MLSICSGYKYRSDHGCSSFYNLTQAITYKAWIVLLHSFTSSISSDYYSNILAEHQILLSCTYSRLLFMWWSDWNSLNIKYYWSATISWFKGKYFVRELVVLQIKVNNLFVDWHSLLIYNSKSATPLKNWHKKVPLRFHHHIPRQIKGSMDIFSIKLSIYFDCVPAKTFNWDTISS